MESWESAVLSCSLPSSSTDAGGLTGKCLRVGVVGASGCGKTAILRRLTISIQHSGRSRVLLFAPYPGPYGRHCSTRAEALRSLARKQSCTIITDPELYLSLMDPVLQRGQIMLLIDEAHELYPKAQTPPVMLKILREGRNLGIGLIWATQRPTACTTHLLGISQGIVIGRLMGLADIQYSKQWGVDQPLPLYSFKTVLPGFEDIQEFKSPKY
jgi:energy-coupling factor transporter ATP-binding protein EcfA2